MKIKSIILAAVISLSVLPGVSNATICTDAMAQLQNALNELNRANDSGSLKWIWQATEAYFIAVEGANSVCEHDFITEL